MKLSFEKLVQLRHMTLGAFILLALIALALAWSAKHRAARDLAAAKAELERAVFVPFEKKEQKAIGAGGVELIQSRRQIRDLIQFDDSYFAATDGGLIETDQVGKVRRTLTVLDGLPESDLTCLASFNSKLFIGTRSKGLVVFDGSQFESYCWPDRKDQNAQAITVLLEDRGRLLVGTFGGGLLDFDGSKFKEIKAGIGHERLIGINCLAVDGPRLLIGTFADGLWISEAGRWSHFTVADGLPSNRVIGVVSSSENLLIATDFGLAIASSAKLSNIGGTPSPQVFQTIATLPSLSSLIKFGDAILASKDNGELFRLIVDLRSPNRSQLVPAAWNRPEHLSSCRLTEPIEPRGKQSGRALWLLSDKGIWRTNRQDERFSGRLTLAPFGEQARADQPSNNLISALAFDDLGRLWAGSFRNGIDVFTPAGDKLAHVESESVREVNALVWDSGAKQMLAATAQGLVCFDGPSQIKSVGKSDGLLSNSISHLAALLSKSSNRSNLVLATSRGLSLSEGQTWRGLTSAQGLPSNSVYAVLPFRESIYAGTLSGLAQITGGRVSRIFNDSNSRLSQNWVTSLCAAGPRLFVGTYGGGVFELTPADEFAGFAGEIGRQTVNPNAMASDGEMLYVGTLDGARILDLHSQKWLHLKSELPANAVLSVTSDEQHVYFGTTSGIARIEKNYLKSIGE